jgi:hypothetical protein
MTKILAFLFATVLAATAHAAETAKKPNVLFIVSDDLCARLRRAARPDGQVHPTATRKMGGAPADR